ncbi:replication protein A 32 kDa subunit B-like [Quercus lobata]|uniref:Replication protein A 32 kDa subunit A n=1 Tax=Quercus lobata TaxID=97700 RepID=A0A7N2L2Y3_QUELO|nr:replication protein A 32 kDa subunit B-like [Quercus lobata]
MYGSEFDGSAAFSGGGFMPSQATQAPDPSFSTSKNRDSQSLLPLTVKQINEALLTSDDKSNFSIDGVEVNNVTLVGRVCNRTGRVTDVTFLLDDGTGRIECNKWVQEFVDSNEVEGILEGMYVRIHGHLKGFLGKRSLNVFSIRPITDFNEIASHFIDCIYVHLYNSRLRKLQGVGVTTQPQMPNPSSTPMMGHQATSVNQLSSQYGNVGGQKNIEQMVLDFLQLPASNADEKGVHRDFIAQQLRVSVDKLMLAIQNLVEEGMIYSTTDDFHFKSTING